MSVALHGHLGATVADLMATHDPLALKLGTKDLFVDLGAQRLMAAEKGSCKIAVEIKSFLGPSAIHDLERALGQYILYRDVLEEREPERVLYLAVPKVTGQEILDEPIGKLLLRKERLHVMMFDPQKEMVVQWIPEQPTVKSSSAS